MAATKKAAASRRLPSKAPRRKIPRKQKAGSAGLDPTACALAPSDPEIAAVERVVSKEGGIVVGQYKDPLGGHALALAVLPIDKIEPTPFQRDLSDTHHKRLSEVIQKTGRFLDPVIAITAPEKVGGFWTPNGRHRLEAMRRLGARSITALVVPTREVA
jgi:ParB family chromosome partitioning protein